MTLRSWLGRLAPDGWVSLLGLVITAVAVALLAGNAWGLLVVGLGLLLAGVFVL